MSIGLTLVRSHKARKVVAIAVLAFVGLFVGRFAGGFGFKYERSVSGDPNQDASVKCRFSDISYEKAVSNNMSEPAVAQEGVLKNGNLLEVYSEETWLGAASDKFEEHEAAVRAAIRKYEGLVRIEQKRGIRPERVLQLVVRVPGKDKYRELVDELRNLGRPVSFQASKEDRSAEVKMLLADKRSLEGYPGSLAALRYRVEGKFSESVDLENKLQNTRRKFEDLSARIEGFTARESFSNLRFDLGEDDYPHGVRAADALRWTLQYYFPTLFGIFSLGLAVWSVRILFAKHER